MVIGTVLGSLVVGYLSTWGPRTGTGQLPNSRMAFGGGVVLPAALQWLSSIAWDALVGLFGGEALAVLLGIPFWVAVLIVLGVQGAVGFFGYELIHRLQAVLTRGAVRRRSWCSRSNSLAGTRSSRPRRVQGADLVGAFVLEVTIAFSLAVSWASYAADFSRYLPADSSRGAGVRIHVRRNRVGVHLRSGHRHRGRRRGRRAHRRGCPVGDGRRCSLGGLALLVIALASIGSGRDERLQRVAGAADDRGQGAAGRCRPSS